MTNKVWISCAFLAACAGSSSSGDTQFQSFAPGTRSLGIADAELQLAISDASGAPACGLSRDQSNSLGFAGHEILVGLWDGGVGTRLTCRTGTYSVRSDCLPAEADGSAGVPTHCAYFRSFDSHGDPTAFLTATAGSVTITGDDPSCNFAVNLTFDGMQWNDHFTIFYVLDSSLAVCTP